MVIASSFNNIATTKTRMILIPYLNPDLKLVSFHKRGGQRGIGTSPVSPIGANQPHHRHKGQQSGADRAD